MTNPTADEGGMPPKKRVFWGQTRGQWLLTMIWIFAGILCISLVARSSETAREVLSAAGWACFTFFTTPFILEASVALLGLCLVIAWNNRRIEREGDDWVLMEVTDETAAEPKPEE